MHATIYLTVWTSVLDPDLFKQESLTWPGVIFLGSSSSHTDFCVTILSLLSMLAECIPKNKMHCVMALQVACLNLCLLA